MKRKLIMQSFAPLFLILFVKYFDCQLCRLAISFFKTLFRSPIVALGHNEILIREYEKTKDAQTSLEALDTIGATAAVEKATGTSAEKVNQYAEIQLLDISFNHAAKMEAQQSGGITLTMRVAGIGAESSGFVIYYDANGNPQVVPFSIVDVDGNGNARITFRLPNPSIIRIFSTVEV